MTDTMNIKELLNRTDRFAANAGCQITEVDEHHAVAEMTVTDMHLNGGNVCQGGALFTLADLAFAAVCNSHGVLTLGISNTIDYLTSARLGDHLTAEATETVNHPKMPQCIITVRNQNGEIIATATGRAYRKSIPFEADGLM